MIEQTIHLATGRSLQKRRGSWVLQPDGRTVEITVEGQNVTITDPDSGRVINDRLNQQQADPLQAHSTKPTRSSADASRWATLNAFVDTAMADLSRAELAVWLVLYRDVREGAARTGMDDIARRAGCHRGSVVRAVQSLQARGLIRLVRRGRKNGGTSVYLVCGLLAPAPGGQSPR